MNEFILDHIKDIKIDLDNKPILNLNAIEILGEGVITLAKTVRNYEIERYNPTVRFEMSSSINPLVPNCFNWFVINVTNYIRIVGLMELMSLRNWKSVDIVSNRENIKNHCRNYVNEVVPDLSNWRNKIVAHPSATDPRSEDNIAILESSLMQLVTYIFPTYQMGGLLWSTDGHTTQLEGWSLTDIYNRVLCPRFWPNHKLDGFEKK